MAEEIFTNKLLSKLKEGVYAVYLFGSVAKGLADERSDIDVLVVVREASEEVYGALADSAFETYLETSRSVEFVTMTVEEFFRLMGKSPFLYEVRKHGRVLHLSGGEVIERARALLELANSYREAAARCLEGGLIRVALDALHNALGLTLKGLILVRGRPLPSTHGGYVHVFGELYVQTGEARRNVVRDLHRALELRNRTRYEPYATLTEGDVDFLMNLCREIEELAKHSIKRTRAGMSEASSSAGW